MSVIRQPCVTNIFFLCYAIVKPGKTLNVAAITSNTMRTLDLSGGSNAFELPVYIALTYGRTFALNLISGASRPSSDGRPTTGGTASTEKSCSHCKGGGASAASLPLQILMRNLTDRLVASVGTAFRRAWHNDK